MKYSKKMSLLKQALGISAIEFKFYRAGLTHWSVRMESGEEFPVITHNLSTEKTVIRIAAEKLAKMDRKVLYPKGA